MTEPHELTITKGVAVGATTWYWLCNTHRFDCDAHMMVFMRIPLHRDDRQERLI